MSCPTPMGRSGPSGFTRPSMSARRRPAARLFLPLATGTTLGLIAEVAHQAGRARAGRQSPGARRAHVPLAGADVVTGGTVKVPARHRGGVHVVTPRCARRNCSDPGRNGSPTCTFAMLIADYSPHASARRFDAGTLPVRRSTRGRWHPPSRTRARRRSRHTSRRSSTACSTASKGWATVATPRDPRRETWPLDAS